MLLDEGGVFGIWPALVFFLNIEVSVSVSLQQLVVANSLSDFVLSCQIGALVSGSVVLANLVQLHGALLQRGNPLVVNFWQTLHLFRLSLQLGYSASVRLVRSPVCKVLCARLQIYL